MIVDDHINFKLAVTLVLVLIIIEVFQRPLENKVKTVSVDENCKCAVLKELAYLNPYDFFFEK